MKTESVIAANRFGLGARPGELATIDGNPRRWLLDQLAGPSRPAAELADLPDSAGVLVEVGEAREMRREARRSDDPPDPATVRLYAETVRRRYVEQVGARYRHAASTKLPFHERLAQFWANHFAVSADKQPLPAVAGLYENEAIRANIGGRFEDLLVAAVSHPAMILYLDNQRSVGPGSPAARRADRRGAERQVGLNENLAREILELHTLGVDGGYGQRDVTEFAHVLTGWSVGGGRDARERDGKPGAFEFREANHDPGARTILGKKYAQSGYRQGLAVLKDLAAHPATASHIAEKLARHFVADQPSRQVVERIAAVFRDSGGDLPAVHRAVVETDAAWATAFAKYKTPSEFLVSTFRAFGRAPEDGRFVQGALDAMGQAPYRPGSPAGWPDTAAAWGGADGLYKRIEWASTVGRFAGRRVDPLEIADAALGPLLGQHSRTTIAAAESESQGLVLLLAAPEFQRR